jgi:hypothetical protein
MVKWKLHLKNYSGMVSMFASSEGRCGFESQLGKTKDYEMRICCFCAKYAVWRSKIKEGFWVMCQSEANCPPMDCCFSQFLELQGEESISRTFCAL